MTTRDQLKALLTAYYADHQAHLHDAAESALDVYADQILALVTPETPKASAIIGYVTPIDDYEVYARDDTVGDQWHGYNIRYTLPRNEWTPVIDSFENREGDLWFTLHDGRYVLAECVRYEKEKPPAPDLFTRVLTASPAYVARFGGTVTLEGALRKMHEEWQEVHEAMANVLADDVFVDHMDANAGPVPLQVQSRQALAGEAIDLLVTVGGVLAALKVSPALITQAAHDTLAKLDARTDEGYVWDEASKTVTARAKLEAGS